MVFDFLKKGRRTFNRDVGMMQEEKRLVKGKGSRGRFDTFKKQQQFEKRIDKLDFKEREEFFKLEGQREKQKARGEMFTRARGARRRFEESARQFGQQQEPDFSVEQESMASMFGQGDKIWGTQGEPVRMNHDLNPRRRGETGTGEMFGF
tara:strand:+ start:33 stop:482 length:450 start_codon:yes stop_codon:yes gene_type:complete